MKHQPDTRKFAPGFRISITDCIALVIGLSAAAILWSSHLWISLIVLTVVGHFFLFCNVFRVERRPELAWAGVFIALCAGAERLGLAFVVAGIMATTVTVILREIRKPSYHGVGWQRLNPNLRSWWEAQQNQKG